VFVAHNVRFDFNFISNSLKVVGIEELLNRNLCTVDLAKKTIDSPKHGLAYLREHLNIDDGEHHRAYADALSACKVLQECFKNIPEHVQTTEDLIKFSKSSNKKKKRRVHHNAKESNNS
jgi:DNA polymerase-3 subunit epsilon